MGEYNIAVIPGDGIGPEVIEEAVKVLDKVGVKFNHKFNFKKVLAGGAAIDEFGTCLPQETIDVCMKSDSVLLGAVGGPKWDMVPNACLLYTSKPFLESKAMANAFI